jgi:hypothetical protein
MTVMAATLGAGTCQVWPPDAASVLSAQRGLVSPERGFKLGDPLALHHILQPPTARLIHHGVQEPTARCAVTPPDVGAAPAYPTINCAMIKVVATPSQARPSRARLGR